ncbi:MAG: Na+/H+ antiporter NhaC family protein [Clostridiales bacterium]|nr:Na+/H+ antiporter NhaC family protein [Clostridiales bacterium]MBR6485021.1 Na+/H+ antiporter NhaC family protein [Clostridiales bacterium]
MYATFWALVPPLVAILLALITKEVYSSLFVGIIVGGLFYSNFSFVGTMEHIFNEGLVAQLSDPYNVGILVFLVFLGIIVSLMNKAGGSAAFGEWASKHVKSRIGSQIATIALGCLIFIDDYFNCLTVGSVMRPLTDRQKISRAKLAYLIDATAAPVCIIAPISSWAAAVSGFAPEGTNGLMLFIRAIPYNYYAILTILMMVLLAVFKLDYGPMKKHEENALKGDLFTVSDSVTAASEEKVKGNGKVLDLVLPIISLIICCVIGMIYTGGFFDGASFVDSFADSDASVGLVFGSFVALLITLILYLIRKVLPFKDCMDCIAEGFKAMVPAITILALAWTLKAMTDSLGAAEYVAGLVDQSKGSFLSFLPAIIFLIAVGLSFATGTSWGTFGILIPITLKAFPLEDGNILAVICVSACMAGAVCGDHCSPISDTTIMSSAGARCNHIAHVSTQLPYALTAAGVSFVTYIIAGIVQNAAISLIIGIALMVITIFFLNKTLKTELKLAEE